MVLIPVISQSESSPSRWSEGSV